MPDVIEESKSARAACRICKDKIAKGVPRFGKESVFRKGDDEFTSFQWHHIECAIKKFPKELTHANVTMSLPDDIKKMIDELKSEFTSSAFDVKAITSFTDPERKATFKTEVARAMKVREIEDDEGKMRMSRTLYVQDDDKKSKLTLWDDFSNLPVQKGDTIIAIDVITKLGGNDEIQFHSSKGSRILVNPSETEIEKNTMSIEIYEAKGWDRPSGTEVVFELAKSSRASCKICGEKIMKSELKLLKPLWMERNERRFPTAESMHVKCAPQDESGHEIIHEAISRLTPELVDDQKEILKELLAILPDIEARNILDTILN
ncbi:MAG: hypothetical protein INQ03_00515 [Candidatus Heimdallarchaeota archaeon]|nr:hypothetical protein [Candidatus Heimdallarchaeota archaeon]